MLNQNMVVKRLIRPARQCRGVFAALLPVSGYEAVDTVLIILSLLLLAAAGYVVYLLVRSIGSEKHRRKSKAGPAVIALLLLITIDVYRVYSLGAEEYLVISRLYAPAAILASVLTTLIALQVPYMFVTWEDRKMERVEFRLRLLRFGMDNHLSDAETAEALCGEASLPGIAARRLRKRLKSGRSLTEALGADRQVFPRSVSSILRAGEKTGDFSSALSCAENQAGLDRLIYTRMNMQLLYPLSLIFFPGFVISTVFVFIHSEFAEMISDLHAGFGTQVEARMISPGLIALIVWGATGLCAAGYLYFRRRLKLRKKFLAFIQVLSSALALGIDEDAALDAAGLASASWKVRRRSRKAKRLLSHGRDLKDAIATAFPRGGELAWFFNQSRRSDAAEVVETWAGMLRDGLERKADILSQALSTLIVLCVGVSTCLIAISLFDFLIVTLHLMM